MICPLELADLCAILRDCDDLSLQEREDAAVALEWLQADNEQMRAALEACLADLKIARTEIIEECRAVARAVFGHDAKRSQAVDDALRALAKEE